MNYYLQIDDRWYVYSEDRWQFLGEETFDAKLAVVIRGDAGILSVCRLGAGEVELLRAMSVLQIAPDADWTMYRETGKETKDDLEEGQEERQGKKQG